MSPCEKSFNCCNCTGSRETKIPGRIGVWRPVETDGDGCCIHCGFYSYKIWLEEDKANKVKSGEHINFRWADDRRD